MTYLGSKKEQTRWLACLGDGGARHAIPLHDQRQHEVSVSCWCKPSADVSPVNSVIVWVHHTSGEAVDDQLATVLVPKQPTEETGAAVELHTGSEPAPAGARQAGGDKP